MRKKTICTDVRIRKKHSTIGKVGIGALITLSLTGMTYPVYVFAGELESDDIVVQEVVPQEENQIPGFHDPVDEAKKAAGHKVYQAAKMVEAQIQNLPNLTTQQMKEFSNQIDSEVMKALASINSTKTPTDAMNAGDIGVKAIEGILKSAHEADDKDINNAKQDAIDTIRKRANDIQDTLANSSLPKSVKNKLADSLDKAESNAIDAINQAKTINDIESAQNDGIKALDAVAQEIKDAFDDNVPLDEAKKDAIDKINQAGDNAHDIINNLPYLSPDEKKDFNDLIDGHVKDGIENIYNTLNKDEVSSALKKGMAEIEMIVQQARDLDMQNGKPGEVIKPTIPATFDASGLASGLAATGGIFLTALGKKSKK